MIRRILASFLLPPGILVTAIVAAAAWHFRKGRRLAGAIHLVAGVLSWAVSISPGADMLVRGLEAPFEGIREPHGDVIVLLGGGVRGGAPDLSGTGTPSDEMWARIGTAVRVRERLGVPVIVSGGKVFRGKAAEAPIVARILVDLGVPADRVIVEDRSRDTRENAFCTARIAAHAGFRDPVLVTSAYHMRRAAMEFRRAGFGATPCPAAFRTWAGKRYGPEDLLPDPASLRTSCVAVREYAALLVYGGLWDQARRAPR